MATVELLLPVLAIVFVLFGQGVEARAVFAHYMLGGLRSDTDHAARDIGDAQALGFDAFALNIAQPTMPWATDALEQLFSQAEQKNFKLFFSMDTSGGWQFSDWNGLMAQYSTSAAYYKGPNGKPFISSFDNNNVFTVQQWADFKAAHDVYFIPDIDHSENYYSNIDAWLQTWGGVVDGSFSWETAWPAGGDSPSNVSTAQDEYVMKALHDAAKTYMIPMSSLQYKHWKDQNQHWYRIGESNLPQRIEEVLALGSSGPEFAEYITWNDAGESHYIGNIWDESISGAEWIYEYANSTTWSHAGWQPLLTSFINAFKEGGDSSTMQPPGGTVAIGAMWYRTILKGASCSDDQLHRPTSADSAQDAVNWAIVLPPGASDYKVRVTSGGSVIQSDTPIGPGLTYDSTPGMQVGSQTVELVDGTGRTVLTARSAMDVQSDSSGVCNFNYQINHQKKTSTTLKRR